MINKGPMRTLTKTEIAARNKEKYLRAKETLNNKSWPVFVFAAFIAERLVVKIRTREGLVRNGVQPN